MNKDKALRLLGLAGLSALSGLPALAQDSSYYYGGLSVGQSQAKIDQDRITASLLGAGLSTTGMTRDERGNGFKLFGGYQFNRNLAIEGGFFDLGKFGFTSTTTPAGTLSGDIKLRGLNLDLVGTLPMGDRWALLGRVGVQVAKATDHFSGTGAVSVLNPNPSERATNLKAGVGLQYEFNPSVLMRLEAERYKVSDAVGNRGSVNLVSVGLVFPFGRAPQAMPQAKAAPAYVEPMRAPAPAPAPAPVVAVAPVVAPVVAAAPVAAAPIARRRVSFSAEQLFGFDRAELRPEGNAALDTFARELVSTRYEKIDVEGHTDRLGTAAYNQTLSQHRADAVKAYLVSKGGIDGGKISVTAKGETMPVTKPADCQGEHQTAKLIACLQPDRRVEVEVTGTR